jgi:catechol 2,3-dioxygenase-like lactoylglutathione lyase family enzyme
VSSAKTAPIMTYAARVHIRRLAHANLSVDDVAAARDFYGRVLGLEPAPRPADAGGRPGCWFRSGDCELHLSLESGADNASSKRHVAFEVDDLAAVRRHLSQAGCPIEEGRPIPGVERFFIRDPAGNRIEFFAVER